MVIFASNLLRLAVCFSLVFRLVQSLDSSAKNDTTIATFDWKIDCRDGIQSPAAATLFYEVTYNGEGATNFTYSVDFVMQWSEDVTLYSTLSGFQLGIPFEYILTYLYPSEGLYKTNFTAVIRIDEEIDGFPNLFSNSEFGAVKIEEESCVYPFSMAPPSVTPTTTPGGSSTADTPTNDTPESSSAAIGDISHSLTILSMFTVVSGGFVYLLLL